MHTLALSTWLFLVFVALVIPYGAYRTARETRSAAGPAQLGSRTHVHLNAMASHLLIFGIAWYAGLLQGLRFLQPVKVTAYDLAAGGAALVVLGALAWLSHVIRSDEERQRMWVLGFMPRSLREGVPFTLMAATAAVSEELAYRGVAFTMLTLLSGSAAAGAVLSAVLFAAAHIPQGGKSMSIIFVVALVKQELVLLTGTLWIAIGIHFVYDVLAAVFVARQAREAGSDPVEPSG